jgi:hypothetical protein
VRQNDVEYEEWQIASDSAAASLDTTIYTRCHVSDIILDFIEKTLEFYARRMPDAIVIILLE